MKRAGYRITSPIRFFVFVSVCTIIAVFGIFTLLTADSTAAATVTTYRQIVVDSNDTLWSIADEYTDDSEDVRVTIDQLKEINDMSSNELQVGDVLFVPVSE